MMATPRTRNRFAGQGDFIRDSGTEKWINIFGDVQLIKNLERVKTAVQRKMMKKAIDKGVKIVAKIAKSKAPKGKTGLLKKSIKSRVTKMVSGKVYVDPKVFAVKNSLTGGAFKRVVLKGKGRKMNWTQIKEKISSQGGDTEYKRPAKYAHLVEFGTKRTQAKPFMRPALQQSRASVLKQIENEIKNGLKKLGAA